LATGAPVDDFDNDSRPIDGDANGSSIHDIGADEARTGGEGDSCSCIIGIFETDDTHNWELLWTDSATTSTVSARLKVAAVSVNSSETGTIIVTIKDATGATTTLTVAHPTTQGDENTAELALTLVPGTRYPFTVEHTGTAHHYKLGSKDQSLAMGQAEISYLEAEAQNWMISVDSGESVKLTFTTDSSNNGANQTNQYKITVRTTSGTVIFAGATTTIAQDTPQTITVGTATSWDLWVVSIEALDGHIRMTKASGTDRFFYVIPCPNKDGTPQDTGGGTPTPVPGVGTWGLVVMTGLLGAVFAWTVRRRRRTTAQA
jgi:hypothetical protein